MISYVVDASVLVDLCVGAAVDLGLRLVVRDAGLAAPNLLAPRS